MKKLLLTLAFVLAPAFAQAEVKVKFTIAEALAAVFEEEEIERLPLQRVYGIALVLPLDGFAWVVEGGMATPETKFTPAYRLITGPSFPLGNRWSWGATVMFQHRPEYKEVPEANILGVGIGPGVKIIDGLSLILVVGGTKVLEESGPYGAAVQPKLSFDLPF